MRAIFVSGLFIFCASISNGQEQDSIKTQILSEIVVTGVKTEGDTLQNFYRSNATATTESILSRMKGVTLMRRGAYGQEPVFRGLSNGQLNVTIDGMKIFGACTDKMDPVTIYVEPLNLSSLQATMGPQGSQFGSTIGGSLNMKLSQPTVGIPGANGQAGIDIQSGARAFNYFSSINLGMTKSAYRANVTYRKSNNYRAGGGEEVPYSQYEKVNIAASGKWAFAKYDTLQADALFDRGWNIGFPSLPMDVGQATAAIFSLTYSRAAPWLVFHNVTAKVYHNEVYHSMDDTHRKDVAIHMEMPGKSQTTGLFVESDVHIFHEHKTIMRAEYFRNTLIGEMTMYPEDGAPMHMQTAPDATRQDAGLFVSQQFRINAKNKLWFSLRGDLISDHVADGIGSEQWKVFNSDVGETSYHLNKTFSANYRKNVKDNLQLEIQTGYGERIPTLNEKFGFYLFNRFDGYDYLGNPELKNENSWNAELNLSYFGSRIELQITPFYQRINNYIIGELQPDLSVMTIGARGVKQNTNIKSASLTGAELMLLASPAPSLQLVTTIKYTHGATVSREAMPLIPPLKSVTSLLYKLNKLNIQGEWEWSAAQHRVSRSFDEQTTPSYSILALRVGWKLNFNWEVSGGIENILDKRYREHLDWGGIPRPGRNLYLNIVYKFASNERK
jgi:iron complex outermembrane receptor protein